MIGFHVWNIVGEPDELQGSPSQALLINAIERCQLIMLAYKPIIMLILFSLILHVNITNVVASIVSFQ